MFSLFKKTLPFIVAGGMLAASHVALAKQITIGMSFQEMNNDYFVTMKQALDQAAADIGAGTGLFTQLLLEGGAQVSAGA